jgi:hypothetical protein
VPTTGPITLDPSTDSGVVGDDRTRMAVVKINGTLSETSGQVSLYDAGTLIAVSDVSAASGGQFSLSTQSGLSAGKHNLTAVWTDSAHTVSAASSELIVTIDNQAANAAITEISMTKAGRGNTVSLLGSASDDFGGAVSVDVYRDGQKAGTSTTANGAWQFDDVKASNAVHTYTLGATDAAGNQASMTQTLIVGTQGADTIKGGAGAELIFGGAGADILTGGGGNDTFIWSGSNEAPYVMIKNKLARPEQITDFSAGDKLDLTGLGHLDFSGQSQTTSADHVNWYFSGGDTFVVADSNGDGKPDFIVQLIGQHALTANDFLLV